MDEQIRICPRAGKPVQGKGTPSTRWFFAFWGLAALIWFLVRVVPKPSRASYPCQRAAAPMAAGFVTWIAGAITSAALFHKARTFAKSGRWLWAAALTAVVIVAGVAWLAPHSGPALQAS